MILFRCQDIFGIQHVKPYLVKLNLNQLKPNLYPKSHICPDLQYYLGPDGHSYTGIEPVSLAGFLSWYFTIRELSIAYIRYACHRYRLCYPICYTSIAGTDYSWSIYRKTYWDNTLTSLRHDIMSVWSKASQSLPNLISNLLPPKVGGTLGSEKSPFLIKFFYILNCNPSLLIYDLNHNISLLPIWGR